MLRFAPLLLLATLAACGSSTPDATPAPDGGTQSNTPDGGSTTNPDGSASTTDAGDVSGEARKLDRDIAAAICARLDSCCSDEHFNAFFSQFKGEPYTLKDLPTRTQCESVLTQQMAIIHDKWLGSVARGRIKFDAARGRACVDAVKNATCGEALTSAIYDPRCMGIRGNEIYAKVTPIGADCQDIADTTFYGECDPKQGFCGTNKKCEAWKKTGEECQVVPTRAFCAPSLSCDNASPTKPGKCSPPPVDVKLGDTCNSLSGALEICPSNAYCDFTGGKCVEKKADGASCNSDDECAASNIFSCWPAGNGKCGNKSFCASRN